MKRMLILVICLILTGCGSKRESTTTITAKDDPKVERTKRKAKEELIYKDDESINSFLNRYNKINDPDITSDMVSKKIIRSHERDDIVDISNSKLEITIYGEIIGRMDVFIGGYAEGSATNDDFKEQFIKYIRVYDNTLNDEEINGYWNDLVSNGYSNKKFKDIDIFPNIFNGKMEYFKIEGNIEFNNK